MSKTLLTSAHYIKEQTELTENYEESKLLPAIRKAQDIELTQALGSSLTGKLQELVETGDISNPENKLYKELLDDYIQPYICQLVLAELAFIGGQHISNFGIAESSDEHIQNMRLQDRMQIRDYYLNIAASYLDHLQRFILSNIKTFSCVMSESDELRIHSNLYSSAECSVFLGGPRGRMTKHKTICNKHK